MTTAQVVETSVTNKSLSQDYPHSDDHTKHSYSNVTLNAATHSDPGTWNAKGLGSRITHTEVI